MRREFGQVLMKREGYKMFKIEINTAKCFREVKTRERSARWLCQLESSGQEHFREGVVGME